MIRVVIADDHAIVRDGLSVVIDAQADMKVEGTAASCPDTLRVLMRVPCDVLILDLSLPGMGGVAMIREVRRRNDCRVVVFSMYPEDQLTRHLKRAGASAFLNKSRAPNELLAAIRQAAAAESSRREAIGQPSLPHELLSARESQIFLTVVEGKAVGDIARALNVSPSTVSTHLAHIKEKLGVDSVAGIVRYAAQVGLVERL